MSKTLSQRYENMPRRSPGWHKILDSLIDNNFEWKELEELRVAVVAQNDEVMLQRVLYAQARCKTNPKRQKLYRVNNPFPEILDSQATSLFPVPLKAKVFFRDLMPLAPWPHPCVYVLRHLGNDFIKEHIWPPASNFDLRHLEDIS